MVLNRISSRQIILFTILMTLLIAVGFAWVLIFRTPGRAGDIRDNPDDNGYIQNGEYGIKQTSRSNHGMVRTTDNTVLILERCYLKCNHSTTETLPINTRFSGLTRNEFESQYPQWRVMEFSADHVRLFKEIEGYCPDHYIMKDYNGDIAIFKPDVESGELVFVEKTNISMDWFDLDMQGRLKSGIAMNSLEEIELYLENMDS